MFFIFIIVTPFCVFQPARQVVPLQVLALPRHVRVPLAAAQARAVRARAEGVLLRRVRCALQMRREYVPGNITVMPLGTLHSYTPLNTTT